MSMSMCVYINIITFIEFTSLSGVVALPCMPIYLHCKNLISVAHSINILSGIGKFLLLWLFANEVYMVVEYFLLAGN